MKFGSIIKETTILNYPSRGSICSGNIIPESDVRGSTCAGMSENQPTFILIFYSFLGGQHDPVYPQCGRVLDKKQGYRTSINKLENCFQFDKMAGLNEIKIKEYFQQYQIIVGQQEELWKSSLEHKNDNDKTSNS